MAALCVGLLELRGDVPLTGDKCPSRDVLPSTSLWLLVRLHLLVTKWLLAASDPWTFRAVGDSNLVATHRLSKHRATCCMVLIKLA